MWFKLQYFYLNKLNGWSIKLFKRHKLYICSQCGYMVWPYKDYTNSGGDLPFAQYTICNGYGWVKLKNPERYVCHHCDAHSFPDDSENDKENWRTYVKSSNMKIRDALLLKREKTQ